MSAYEKVSKTIDGVQYDVTLLGAKVASRVLLKLTKSVAPVFMAAAMGRGGIDIGKATDAIKGLSEEDFDWVVEQFAARTDVHLPDGRAPNLGSNNGAVFDQHFSGKYSALLAWIEFSVESNFSALFLDLKRRMGPAPSAAAPSPAPSPSPSPSTSTGA